jgi:hypothetical protein
MPTARIVWVGIGALGVALLLSACASSATPAPTPTPAAVAGSWGGEQTVTNLTGGECLGPELQDLVGRPGQFRATLTQAGRDVTALMSINHTGGECTYAGTIDGGTIDLKLTGCTGSGVFAIACPNGAVRDVLPLSLTLHGMANGSTITGMATEVDTVVVSGTTEKVADLIASGSFTLMRP